MGSSLTRLLRDRLVVLAAMACAAATALWSLGVLRRRLSGGSRPPVDPAKLGALWTGATEFMLSVPGSHSDVVLVPQADVPEGEREEMPSALRAHTIFALTAFDPPGVARTLAENAAANARLWGELARLVPRPEAAWRVFGVNLAESWREDGFCLAFGGVDVAAAREAVVEVARRFDQGAIFEYEPASGRTVVRHTVPAAADEAVAGTEVLARVRHGPPLAGSLARPWAGPAEVLL